MKPKHELRSSKKNLEKTFLYKPSPNHRRTIWFTRISANPTAGNTNKYVVYTSCVPPLSVLRRTTKVMSTLLLDIFYTSKLKHRSSVDRGKRPAKPDRSNENGKSENVRQSLYFLMILHVTIEHFLILRFFVRIVFGI